jgi:hypothetical protein
MIFAKHREHRPWSASGAHRLLATLPTLSLICVLLGSSGARAESSDAIDFGRDIRPILSNKCFKCHGPDEETREADLRLDRAEGATADLGGYRAIDLDDPQSSELLRRVLSSDEFERMPPPDSGLDLSADEARLLEQWIEQGAVYEPHWSFRPLEQPPIPTISANAEHRDWIQHPIDHFVLEALERVNLSPSAEADRATLIRRVHLDLLGLPPAPEQVAEFLEDSMPDAYARMVDRALASPHYGERWGRHWLDQARYADSHGYTVDSDRSMWPYRDWVIAALNRDLPFDQFTLEQLAGDLLPNPTQDQLVATGFHRNTLINQEGGTDREQFRNEAVVDRANTTGAVWLGLTVGCAQCHTHKFDPLTHHEYYQLFAFFNSGQDVNSVAPTLRVASPEQQERLAEFDRDLRAARGALADYEKEANEQLAEEERKRQQPVEWSIVRHAEVSTESGAEIEQLGDGSFLVRGENTTSDTYSLTFPAPQRRITAVRLEVLTHPSLPHGGPGRAGNGNFVLTHVELQSGENSANWLHASADHSQKNYDVTGAINADREQGWAINVSSGVLNANRTATFVSDVLPTPDEQAVTFRLHFGPHANPYNLGRFRVSVTDVPHADLDLPDPRREALAAEVQRIEAARQKFAAAIPETMVMRELDKPRETHVLIRGDFLRQGDQVQPGTPAVLPPLPADSDSSTPATRLDLARWLVSDTNPLTPRVTVNRVWMRFFGQGLVETENDFGLQGTLPTHPELLDWLAAEFRDRGWSLKQLHREILLSATYRQSSHVRNDLASKDPLNKWLGRQQRLRLDAEVIRDSTLAASGLLHGKIGGPSVYPPQPDGVYAFTQSQRRWPTSEGGDRFRRGMYIFFMRSAPYPMLTTFDVPRFNTTCTARVRSNTPLQSLTLANDEAVLEMARALGHHLASLSHADREKIDLAVWKCFARPATPFELERLQQYFEQQRESFAAVPEDAREIAGDLANRQVTRWATKEGSSASTTDSENRESGDATRDSWTGDSGEPSIIDAAAWTAVARVLFNLDEFIIRE